MTDPVWANANIWESVAAALPDEPAVIQGDQIMDWRTFDTRANGLAAHLLAAGLKHQSKVGIYTKNCAEYLVASYAAFKAGLVPFNINYRYGAEEVAYLLDNSDAEAVIFDADYADTVGVVRDRLAMVKCWIGVARECAPVPDWATDYDDIPDREGQANAPWGRSGDDLLFIYTGGTTGMPKGVMWRQGALLAKGGYGANPLTGLPSLESPEQAGPRAKMLPLRPRSLIAPPLMHGTGMLSAFGALTGGGCVILLPQGNFSGELLWDMAAKYKATRVTIVGQPFAQPMLEALEANPGHWDLSSIFVIGSSGAMWSRENKQGLIRHIPQVTLADSFSSSEALGLGVSMMNAASEIQTAQFTFGADCAVFAEDGRRVEPGSGERGRVAVGGHIPLGYYKDEAKSAATFVEFEGRRWSMPGDWAEVNEDGSLTLLGRGSQCINSGGEKIFPEEVEEVLKRHDAVRDAAVSGIPDDRFGERIAALVELHAGATANEPELVAHVKSVLSHYKAPRHVLVVKTIPRAPNGKMDYQSVKAQAVAAFGSEAAA